MAYYDDFFGDSDFQDAKEFLIDDYVHEFELDQEETHTFTRRQWIEMYYACPQGEMMWRARSHNPEKYNIHGDDAEEYETECRAEMKKYRVLQNAIALAINF